MTIVSGVRTTGNIESGRPYVPFDNKVALLQPRSAPLVRLLAKIGKKKVDGAKFEWWEDELGSNMDNVTDAQTAAELTVNVDNPSRFLSGDMIKVARTGEVMLAGADGGSVNAYITVTRGVGSTTAKALLADDELFIIGNVNAEGSDTRTVLTTQTVNKYNYCQIFKTPYSVSNTSKASKIKGGSDLILQRKKKAIEHKRDIEMAFWLGERYISGSTTAPIRGTGGILERISTNVTVLDSGNLTEWEWLSWLRSAMQYGSDTRYVFCSPLVMDVITGFGAGKVRLLPSSKTMGLAISRYICPHGTVNLIMHKEFKGDTYGGMAVALDLADNCVTQMTLRGTKLEKNIQTKSYDKQTDQYITETGIKIKEEKRHAALYNVQQ